MSLVRVSFAAGFVAFALLGCAEKSASSDRPATLAPPAPPAPKAVASEAPASVAPAPTAAPTPQEESAEELRVTRALAPSASGPQDKRSLGVQQGSGGAVLSVEVVHRVVRQSYPKLHACYAAGLKKTPDLQGRLTVKLVIAKDGAARSAVVTSGDLPDKTVTACVTKTFASLSFPPPDHGEMTVNYPVAFSPSDG